MALTGAAITYRTFTKELLGVSNITSPIKPSISNEFIAKHWQSWLTTAYKQMPEGSTLVQIRYPRPARNKQSDKQNDLDKKTNKTKVLTFKCHTPNNWLGLAQSNVRIDINNSQLIQTQLFKEFSIGEKIYALIKPLHTGHGLPVVYVVVQFILSLLGTIFVCSGVILFINKKRKKSVKNFITQTNLRFTSKNTP